MPEISTRTLRVVVAVLLLLAGGAIFSFRGGGGSGIDVFTEDLASAGIDPETIPEQVERASEVPEQNGAELTTGDEFAASSEGTTASEGTEDADPLDRDGSTDAGLGAEPDAANAASRSTTQTNTQTTAPSRYRPPATSPAPSVAIDGPGSNSVSITPSGDALDGPASSQIPAAATSSDQTTSTPTSPAASPASTPTGSPASPAPITVGSTAPAAQAQVAGAWCHIEIRESDGVIRWNDEGRTSVFRLNDAWFHTPDPDAQAVIIPDPVDTGDEYILRLWTGGTDDIVCTFSSLPTTNPAPTNQEIVVAAPAPTTAAPTTTTTTTTTIPEAVAFTALPAPIRTPSGPPQIGFAVDVWGDERTNYWNDLSATPGAGRLIAHEFKSFIKPVNTDLYRWHMQSGRDLLLTWNGTDAETILNGSHDDWIRHHAQELKSLPGTVKLRFWHEPDVSHKRAWIDNDPQQFIDSWMHVRRLFVEEQALNIEWVWCPTAWNWNEQGARYYPGDANVDWICADGYSGWDLNAPVTPVENAYRDFQAWANQRPHKPILVAEFGVSQRAPEERAEWIAGIPSWVQASSNIRAVVYFDIDRRPNGEIYDWRIRNEPQAWNAMLNVISSAPFGR